NDSLIYGSFREGLRFLKKGKVHNYEQDYFTQSRYYFSCFINDNHFYIGTRDGLLQFKNGITTFHRGVNRIRTISRLGDSLLIGTEYGLEMFDLKSEKLIDTKDFIEEDFNFYVNDISVVGRNDWWLATDKHGILRMVEGKVVDQLTTANGLCHNHTLSMCFDANRNLWVGTHDGLSVYKNGKFLSFSTDDGLSHSLIHTLALDSAGFLWAGTERGLNRISLEQDKLVTKIYGINEGFLGNDCAENSVFIEPDNTIWWGTGTKISKYNPLLDQEDLIPPSVRIDEVLVHFRDVHHYEKIGQTKGFQYSRISKWNNLPENLELQHFMNHITIKFISIDWKTPDKLLYQFKLEGFEDEWSPAATKKSVTYSNLAAGKYTFLVKARNDDGYWSEPKSFSFVVHPPWWKTIFARIIFSVIVLLMLISYINLRTKNLKAKQKELEKIVRERTTEIKFQKDEIEKQKELVDLKNKEITDSVKYASRIQRALLEPEDHVNKLMPEHFIFFQPRNIVSGDFYWSNIQDNSVFICAADCTGHGVPGAMLSMLGISFLNQISHNNSQIGPDDILNKLRKHMIRELSQKGLDEDSKDGIDAGLIKLQNGTAHYAGANNAAYVIRDKSFPAIPGDRKIVENETKVLYEIRGDKQPIGYHPNKNWDFNSSSFETHKGDLIYLFSDGFPDQFGGKKGKKLKYAPFKQYLLSICHLDINAQKLEIQSKFQEWKGEYEQVDDVLVIGIRI
ncbi:MAG: SpoIIE family protein phosphatase, partial [Flavobacteriales bacterium]|nr:SpoIIE family protein phosphatase [Flavobacteriales bacterium]